MHILDFLFKQGYDLGEYTEETRSPNDWFKVTGDKLLLPSFQDIKNGDVTLCTLEAKVYWFLRLRNTLQFDKLSAKVISSAELLYLLQGAKSVAVDIETTNANWNDNKVLCCGFCIDGKPETRIVEANDLDSRCFNIPGLTYIWHNGVFDLAMLKHLTGIEARLSEDTMLEHYALIDETPGNQKLKDLSVLYLDSPRWDETLKEFRKAHAKAAKKKLKDTGFDLIAPEVLYYYNAFDTYCTWWLHSVFQDIGDQECLDLYRMLCDAASIYARIGQRGMLVDFEYLAKYEQELKEKQTTAYQVCQKEWLSYFPDAQAINLQSPVQLKRALQQVYPTLEITSTGKDALFDLPPSVFLENLRDYKRVTKLLHTYIEGVKGATGEDGRCRAGFKLTGTATGRLSSGADSESTAKFNYQNISRDKQVKRIFKAPTGYKFLQFDMSGCELRVMAALARDPEMCRVFQEDRDLHGEVAQSIWGDEYTKENRSSAKTLNFGIAYGMGAKMLQRRLHLQGIEVTFGEAIAMQSAWNKKYKKVAQWLDRESINGMRGYIPYTMFQRKRRFVLKPGLEWQVKNEARNFQIQSVASDLVLRALMRIDEDLRTKNLDCVIVNTVHDSIVLEVYDSEELIKQVKDIVFYHMETRSTEEFGGIVPFKADCEEGYTYAMDKEGY